MTVRRFSIAVPLSSGGAAEVYSPKLSGKLISINYSKDNYSNGVDFVITAEASGETLWSEENVNATSTRHPRAATHGITGAAALYASGGTAVNGYLTLGQDRIKIVIANGGTSTSGTFHFTIDG